MKTLFFGIVLILIIGFGGFFYRNVSERGGAPLPLACTEEAKVCPDGSAVGRTGPSCAFAPCPPLILGTTPDMSVVLPDGYVENKNPNVDMATGGDISLQRQFEKASTSGSAPHSITLHDLGVDPEDVSIEDAEDNIVRDTVFSPSDMPADSIAQFKKVLIAGHLFYAVTLERFEGVVHSRYYLPLQLSSGGMNLYSFDIIERDVDWTNPDLVIEDLPEHKAFLSMLATLQIIP